MIRTAQHNEHSIRSHRALPRFKTNLDCGRMRLDLLIALQLLASRLYPFKEKKKAHNAARRKVASFKKDLAKREDSKNSMHREMLWEDDSSRRTPPLICRKKHTADLNIIVAPFSSFSFFFCTAFRVEMIYTEMSYHEKCTSAARVLLQRLIDALDAACDRFGTLSSTFVFRRSGTCKKKWCAKG